MPNPIPPATAVVLVLVFVVMSVVVIVAVDVVVIVARLVAVGRMIDCHGDSLPAGERRGHTHISTAASYACSNRSRLALARNAFDRWTTQHRASMIDAHR